MRVWPFSLLTQFPRFSIRGNDDSFSPTLNLASGLSARLLSVHLLSARLLFASSSVLSALPLLTQFPRFSSNYLCSLFPALYLKLWLTGKEEYRLNRGERIMASPIGYILVLTNQEKFLMHACSNFSSTSHVPKFSEFNSFHILKVNYTFILLCFLWWSCFFSLCSTWQSSFEANIFMNSEEVCIWSS